ncbi:CHAT domain-containing protein [Dactylosporangium darangshiense]|uniref:CHAT domain-containing protein n=1 Tax=Dactylosporangium darangshiense TaxID=579108 RepID=UPI003629A180
MVAGALLRRPAGDRGAVGVALVPLPSPPSRRPLGRGGRRSAPARRGAEAEAVAAVHRGAALTGAAATVGAVLAALPDAGLVHLAAHGRLSAENPLFSDIELADGPLMVYDVERLPRVPHTLVLAACDSGRPVVRTGDELMGLGVAFLARGAAQLVASVLPVPDATTRPLMVAFHEGLAAGRSPAAALAEAQAALRRADPEAAAAAAGFVCIGAGIDPLFA